MRLGRRAVAGGRLWCPAKPPPWILDFSPIAFHEEEMLLQTPLWPYLCFPPWRLLLGWQKTGISVLCSAVTFPPFALKFFIFITASVITCSSRGLLPRDNTQSHWHYLPLSGNKWDACQPADAGWLAIVSGEGLLKNLSSIIKLIHPAVCDFNMKNYLAYFEMLVVEIHFVFLRLDKQLTSAISAFKNSLKKPAWFDLFAQRKDCSLIPLELLYLILLPVELMKNPLARHVKKPRNVPGHSMSSEDGRYLEGGRARAQCPYPFTTFLLAQ